MYILRFTLQTIAKKLKNGKKDDKAGRVPYCLV